jgi:hypothetical protein
MRSGPSSVRPGVSTRQRWTMRASWRQVPRGRGAFCRRHLLSLRFQQRQGHRYVPGRFCDHHGSVQASTAHRAAAKHRAEDPSVGEPPAGKPNERFWRGWRHLASAVSSPSEHAGLGSRLPTSDVCDTIVVPDPLGRVLWSPRREIVAHDAIVFADSRTGR